MCELWAGWRRNGDRWKRLRRGQRSEERCGVVDPVEKGAPRYDRGISRRSQWAVSIAQRDQFGILWWKRKPTGKGPELGQVRRLGIR